MSSFSELLTHDEMKIIGKALHDRWVALAGEAPLKRDDLGWGDVVYFVNMMASETRAKRAK